ncbi:growth hormone secretagogue receptor type 1-like [Lingula anatina]|uniref:Growth hormone secretagogue receptor type 1-like n=1 Tax=Lingula anatina TaxID=7574 RepID=A0A1S3JS85_LINAN|nr:growth hormone secretagogue receptor type 1-like [Lingula anatina]|eukprot:XP_013412869.1 growth hormone secretagogue receptor type 1-like [Lingula anatina]
MEYNITEPLRNNQSITENLRTWPLYILVWISVTFMFIFISGVSGNLLVLFVILKNKHMRKSTDLFIANLSVADLLVLVVCMSAAMIEVYANEVWTLGEVMCKTVPFLEHLVEHASAMSIVGISIERYYVICKPFYAHIRWTRRQVILSLVSVWVTSALATSPFLVIAEETTSFYANGDRITTCNTSINTVWKRVYVIVTTSLFFFLPVCLLVCIYSPICWTLAKANRKKLGGSETSQRYSLKKRKQVIIVIIAVTVVFFACLLPFRVFSLWAVFGNTLDKKKLSVDGWLNLTSIVRALFYLNSAVNPILYNTFSSKFRRAFSKAVRACLCARNPFKRQTTLSTDPNDRSIGDLKETPKDECDGLSEGHAKGMSRSHIKNESF